MSDIDKRPPFRKGGGRGRPRPGRGNGGRGDNPPQQPQQPPREPQYRAPKEPTIPFNAPDCPICKKPVTDIFAAIAELSSQEPAHFDCVFASISAEEKLEEGDKIIYLGNGSFAVINYPDPANPQKFAIKRRIQYEEKDKKLDWRRAVAKYKP
jgi:hypothetical protein